MSLCSTLFPRGTRALGKVLFLDCQGGKCQKKHPRLVSHSFFLPYPCPLDTSQLLQHHSRRVLSSIGGVTLRKEAGGGNPTTRNQRAPGTFQSSSSPETPPREGVSLFSLQARPPGSGGNGLMQRAAGTPGPQGRRSTWQPPSPAPRHSSLGTQACSGSRAVTPAQDTKA